VQLKPHIDLIDSPGKWRGSIEPSEGFMDSYRGMITHLARLANNTHCEQFCIGTELDSTISEKKKWYRIINSVSSVYSNSLTYAANHHTEHDVSFWDHDAIRFIGSDFYYAAPGPVTLDNIMQKLSVPAKDLLMLSERYGKQVLLTEFGLMAVRGANADPHKANFSMPYSLEEQSLRIRAVLDLFYDQPWCAGGHAWAYWRRPESAPENIAKGYNLYKKDSEIYLIQKYLKPSS